MCGYVTLIAWQRMSLLGAIWKLVSVASSIVAGVRSEPAGVGQSANISEG